MAEKNLRSALQDSSQITQQIITLNQEDFLKPSYLVAMAAYIRKSNIPAEHFQISSKHQSYLETIGFINLWGNHDKRNRPNLGINYSMLTLLENEEVVDIANTQIISCINHFTNNDKSSGIASLKEVIGELHDNIWSHGRSTGFSMAQKYNDGKIEIAVADCGLGFLSELQRIGMNIASHKEALEWCIQKGNSSKKVESERHDDWGQQLPADIIGGSPMGKYGRYRKENNHMGLGLDKLIQLIMMYKGTLQIISGNAYLSITPSDNRIQIQEYQDFSWQGVVIVFELKLQALQQIHHDDNNGIQEILDFLNG